MLAAVRASANSFSLELTAEQALTAYERLLPLRRYVQVPEPSRPHGERRDAGAAIFKPTRLLPNYGFRAAKTSVGVIAIAAGAALLIAHPGSLHSLVQSATAAELAEDPSDFGANLLRDGFAAFVPGDAVFVAAFLLLHGLIRTLISVAAPSIRWHWAHEGRRRLRRGIHRLDGLLAIGGLVVATGPLCRPQCGDDFARTPRLEGGSRTAINRVAYRPLVTSALGGYC